MLAAALSQREALSLASAIAHTIFTAHERGIIYGMLSPAAIFVGDDRSVTVDPAAGAAAPDRWHSTYLSPEQVRGRPADRRSDIWAFGCILFEMLSGSPAFASDSPLAPARSAVLERHPDWSRLPGDVPTRILHLLRHCLQKDPKDRLHDIGDARIEIDATLRTDTDFIERVASSKSRLGPRLGWMTAALLPIVAAWLFGDRLLPAAADETGAVPAMHAVVPVQPGATLAIGRGASIALSADGSRLVYVAESQGQAQLFLRPLDRFDARPVPGSTGAADPFFSPDGRWIGFFAGENLMKVPVDGGAAVTIAGMPTQRGLTWTADDMIYVTPRDNTGLWRVPATGGALEAVTTLADGDASHRWPQVLPGGTAVMYTIWNGAWEPARIAVQPLAGGKADPNQPRRIIVTGGGFARFVPGGGTGQGRVIYTNGDALFSVPFDVRRFETTGPPRSLADGLITNFSGGAQFAVASNGLIAYVSSGGEPQERELDWVTREGTTTLAAKLPGLGRWYDLAPDGRRVVRYKTDGATRDVWVDDLSTGATTRLSRRNEPSSSGPIDRLNAAWSGDGRAVVYAAGQPLNLFTAAADGSGGEQRLTTNINTQWPGSWSPDGSTIAFVENNPQSGSDIWLVSLDAARRPGAVRPFLSTPFNESAPMISPDGRWLAYQSNESGRYEIYVQPFPGGGQRIQVSPDNGVYPRWSPRGDELFFRSASTRAGMSVAAFDGRGRFSPPRQLFELRRFESILEVSPDAQRFLMMPAEARGSAPAVVHVMTQGAGR